MGLDALNMVVVIEPSHAPKQLSSTMEKVASGRGGLSLKLNVVSTLHKEPSFPK